MTNTDENFTATLVLNLRKATEERRRQTNGKKIGQIWVNASLSHNCMKKILVSCLFLLVLNIGLEGQTGLSGPRLSGIVNFPDAKLAVLEVHPAAFTGTICLGL